MDKRTRSPNYPTISLKEAYNKIQAVYQKEHTHSADMIVIAKALGYMSINGKSRSVISALMKYGLLEPIGNQYKVSAQAIDMLLHHRGEPERVKAIKASAFLPTLFAELHDRFGDNLPSDHNLEVYLLKKNFNPNTVGNVIRSYRDTIAFVQEETENFDDNDQQELHDEVVSEPRPEETWGAKDSYDRGVATTSVSGQVIHRPQEPASQWDFSYVLGDGVKVSVEFKGRGTVTRQVIDRFLRLLEVNKDVFPVDSGVSHTPTEIE